MKPVIILSFLIIYTILPCQANDFSHILKAIEANSPHLAHLNQETTARQSALRANNALNGPSVEAGHLWGTHTTGNRIDLSISQTFDFPIAYGQRRRLTQLSQNNAQNIYLDQRRQYLLRAKQLCIQAVFCNALIRHLSHDLYDAQALANSIKKQYENGEATAIDYHKAEQSATMFTNEHSQYLTQLETVLATLRQMNGGHPVSIPDSLFVHTPLPINFPAWLNRQVDTHPAYLLAQGQLLEKKQALKLSKSLRLPRLSIGYTSEKTRSEHYQGPTLGLSLPLWNSRHLIRAHRQDTVAARLACEDTRQEVITHLTNLYQQAQRLRKTIDDYTTTFTLHDNNPLLRRSLLHGQINLITYLQEIHWNHDMHIKQLQAQCDLELTIAELTANEL